jgi:hypothetical protein
MLHFTRFAVGDVENKISTFLLMHKGVVSKEHSAKNDRNAVAHQQVGCRALHSHHLHFCATRLGTTAGNILVVVRVL